MTLVTKLAAGAQFPSLTFATLDAGLIDVAALHGWRLLVIYRGHHCPLCKKYLSALDALLDDFKAVGVQVFAVSADPVERAEADIAEFRWRFPVGYGLTVEQMRQIGVYISQPRTPPDTDHLFAEPGLFLVNPDGKAQIIDISNAPYARPEPASILMGIKIIQERGFPIRGTVI